MHDPLGDSAEARHEYGLALSDWEELPTADAIVIAVAPDAYRLLGAGQIAAKLRPAVVSFMSRDCSGAAPSEKGRSGCSDPSRGNLHENYLLQGL